MNMNVTYNMNEIVPDGLIFFLKQCFTNVPF